jgi:phospholipid/cholesterol/gamma-HCH transport system permease protein
MKVTEQIDAMEVSACNPFKFLVVTRITATTLMFPLLVVYADFLGLIGVYCAINFYGHKFPLYHPVFEILEFEDVIPAL